MPEGFRQYFAESPFGPAFIETGSSYLSGLGEECRLARAVSGEQDQNFALCKETTGAWRFIPSIFEGMPR